MRLSSEGSASTVICVDGVSKNYKNISALSDVSFRVREGTRTGIVGPNGAGKTTLLNILQGIVSPDRGRCSIFGIIPNIRTRSVTKRVGVSAQSVSFNPLLKVRELFELYSVLYDHSWDPYKLMDHIGLDDKVDTRFGHLSGGQKRRVAVALALIGRPEVLLLDEPTGELDPQARSAIWELIQKGTDAPQTVLLATHQMEEVENLCDEVIILDHGTIIDNGSPDYLISKHCPNYKIKFEVSIHTSIEALQFPVISVENKVAARCVQITLPNFDEAFLAMKYIRESFGQKVIGISIHGMTLNDVFLKLTGRKLRD